MAETHIAVPPALGAAFFHRDRRRVRPLWALLRTPELYALPLVAIARR
jgi:hypothetical protein